MTAYVRQASFPPHLVDHRDPPAIALLKEDHQMLRALFDMIETADDDVVYPIAGEISVRLAIHMAVEEQLFYPALRSVIGVDDIDQGIVEHEVAKRLISDIMEMTGREELFRARVHVLGEATVHHVDEEDRVLFRDARRAWEEGKIDLVELGKQMRRQRRELFDLVGLVSADSHTIDLELVGETIEELPQSGRRNGVAARVPSEEEM